MAEQLEFNTQITYKDKTLFVEYSVKNNSDRDVYLVNQVYKVTPAWDIGPHVVYIKLNVDKRQIEVFKKLPDIPSDKQVVSPVSPFVTPVRAGEEFSETIKIPAPVAEYVEYGSRPIDETALPTDFEAVTFELGYYWRADGGTEVEQEVQGEKFILPKNPPGVLADVKNLKHGPVKLNVPVLMPKVAKGAK
jgi:hypothetical protein